MCGIFFKITGSFDKQQAVNIGNELFFDPDIDTLPFIPLLFSTSIQRIYLTYLFHITSTINLLLLHCCFLYSHCKIIAY
ncbi:hypothetical protein SDC9_207307 [bioreactor metagenome]|uniref:Uncharacterized protein n=1 Tax=bioreactor metagenome TaxID=1076179 RepID=A0A645J826_9ZZZZ